MFIYNKHRGVTLIELIVVIGMLGLLSGIALPRLETSTYSLLNAARGLRDELREIRDISMTEGEVRVILFKRESYLIQLGSKVLKEVILPKDFSLYQNFKESEVAFSPDGSPMFGGGTVSIVNNKSKKYCEITVVPATGRILLKDEIFSGHK